MVLISERIKYYVCSNGVQVLRACIFSTFWENGISEVHETWSKWLYPSHLKKNSLLQQTAEIDETLKRLSSRKGVKAVVILNSEGQAIRSTMNEELTKQYGQLISALVTQARTTVSTLDDQVSSWVHALIIWFRVTRLTAARLFEQNDLTFLRVRTKKHEIMIAPGKFIHDAIRIRFEE